MQAPPTTQTLLLRLARNVNWHEPPEALAADTRKLLNETMARGSDEDIREARALFSEERPADVYRNAPPGLYSRSHWAYWGLVLLGDPEARRVGTSGITARRTPSSTASQDLWARESRSSFAEWAAKYGNRVRKCRYDSSR